jgi:hypothetical protein
MFLGTPGGGQPTPKRELRALVAKLCNAGNEPASRSPIVTVHLDVGCLLQKLTEISHAPGGTPTGVHRTRGAKG